MEQVANYKTNCIITSVSNDYIEEWTDSHTSNKTLIIAPITRYPHLIFYHINQTHYEWCGPMIVLAKYLGIMSKSRVKLNSPVPNFGIIFQDMFEGRTAIALQSFPSYHYVEYVIDKGWDSRIKLSPYIDFTDTSKILARTKQDEYHIFKLFECFEPEVYYGIIVSVIVVSVVISLSKMSIEAFFTNVWTYFTVIINGSYHLDHKSTVDLIFSSLWLLVSFTLLAAFSGMLRDLLIKPHPIYWVDSWDDLMNWHHLKIQTIVLTDLANFIRKNPDNLMSKEFTDKNRIELFSPTILTQNLDKVFDFDGIAQGKVALVFPSQYLHVLKNNLVQKDMEEDLDFHISQFGDPWKSCFVFHSHKNMDLFQRSKLSLIIEMLRESGIYDHMVKVGLNPSRVGPDVGEYHPTNEHEFDTLVIRQMRGSFLLYLIFGTISILVFLIEMRKVFNKKKHHSRRRTLHVIAMDRKKSYDSYWNF